jgi:phenylacetate-CoA ligase
MWGERIYSRLPQSFQNIAVSLKGWEFHRQRYLSESFRQGLRWTKENEQQSLEFLRRLQMQQLLEFANHCYERSPYYRRLWDSKSVKPWKLRRLEDLSLIPIVPKGTLRSRTEEFFTEKIGRNMIEVHTSGTTGSPMTVYFSKEDVGLRSAFLERCRRWAGVHIGQKRASFTGRNVVPARQQKPPYWRYNRPGNQLLFSAYHLAPENLPGYVQALAKFRPKIIDGYPSAIHIVAEYLLRQRNVGLIHPDAILVSAETVLPHQRTAIETAFQTKLYNQYASSDGAPFISECHLGHLHYQLDSGVIEILNFDGTPVAPGQAGQMVVTCFTTHVTPFFRVAIGDAAVAAPDQGPCECGLPFPLVDAIIGRVDDILQTPDRGFVGRLDTAFKRLPNSVIEAQIVQVSPRTIVLKIVPDPLRYEPGHSALVVEELRKRLGSVVEIVVEEVTSIPRTTRGKMRPVVNLCKDLLPPSLRYWDSEEDLVQNL